MSYKDNEEQNVASLQFTQLRQPQYVTRDLSEQLAYTESRSSTSDTRGGKSHRILSLIHKFEASSAPAASLFSTGLIRAEHRSDRNTNSAQSLPISEIPIACQKWVLPVASAYKNEEVISSGTLYRQYRGCTHQTYHRKSQRSSSLTGAYSIGSHATDTIHDHIIFREASSLTAPYVQNKVPQMRTGGSIRDKVRFYNDTTNARSGSKIIPTDEWCHSGHSMGHYLHDSSIVIRPDRQQNTLQKSSVTGTHASVKDTTSQIPALETPTGENTRRDTLHTPHLQSKFKALGKINVIQPPLELQEPLISPQSASVVAKATGKDVVVLTPEKLAYISGRTTRLALLNEADNYDRTWSRRRDIRSRSRNSLSVNDTTYIESINDANTMSKGILTSRTKQRQVLGAPVSFGSWQMNQGQIKFEKVPSTKILLTGRQSKVATIRQKFEKGPSFTVELLAEPKKHVSPIASPSLKVKKLPGVDPPHIPALVLASTFLPTSRSEPTSRKTVENFIPLSGPPLAINKTDEYRVIESALPKTQVANIHPISTHLLPTASTLEVSDLLVPHKTPVSRAKVNRVGDKVKKFEEIQCSEANSNTINKTGRVKVENPINCESSTLQNVDGSMSEKDSLSGIEESENWLIRRVECALKQPKPLRVVEMKRMMHLCRGMIGGGMRRMRNSLPG
ncbi:Bgt-5293 [Blumeria graminis f. sp. tritici]|uniref:Bgt-5293 n=2 Tax=Blumeria graminis f. sp. tritici TaxID=62690 RepID=A0A381LBZ6_BLUGR|nr:hypothetical protein BGT96224_5293 [Blumeria graminis f. sp. tritici 96224]VCU41266.1 Bgt-5293 [Blumeria graminis f. sp. tritici]